MDWTAIFLWGAAAKCVELNAIVLFFDIRRMRRDGVKGLRPYLRTCAEDLAIGAPRWIVEKATASATRALEAMLGMHL